MKEPIIEQIQQLVREGFTDWKSIGEVNTQIHGDLMIFNYNQKAQYEGRWNDFERVSRGLIVNRNTGEIVARPFDKFFNWMEGNRFSHSQVKSITEKVDGSLGILYRYNGEYKVSTRGSFTSDQAEWATERLQRHLRNTIHLPKSYTLLFEIIYPENRVVVDYGPREDLVLLAVRDRFTGEYRPWWEVEAIAEAYDFALPTVYHFYSVTDVINLLPIIDVNKEGYVVEFTDGQRFKFKGQKYLELHRLISHLSFKNTLAAVVAGTVGDVQAQIPEEFLDQFNAWVHEIELTREGITAIVLQIFNEAPKVTRKDFAQWVMSNYKGYAHYLFAMYDQRDITPLIYKTAFENHQHINQRLLTVTEETS